MTVLYFHVILLFEQHLESRYVRFVRKNALTGTEIFGINFQHCKKSHHC